MSHREADAVTPKKSFGQNFLTSPHVVTKIVDMCMVHGEGTTVVEFGAGTGVLTRALAERGARVWAVERDRDLVPRLRTDLGHFGGRIQVVEADAQTVEFLPWLDAEGPNVLAGNLPYQITGRLLRRAMEHAARFRRVVFMVQREVADRIIATPRSASYGALSVFVQAAFRPERAIKVGPGCFFPPPRVHSAVVLLTPRGDDAVEETPTFRILVRAAFAARRKTLRNAWRGLCPDLAMLAEVAGKQGVRLEQRGEELSVEQFAAMAKALGRIEMPTDAAALSPDGDA